MGKRKIINEFSICEPQKAELADFLYAHLDALNAKDPDARAKLIALIRGTNKKPGIFSKETLDQIEKTLQPNSEIAVLIRNLPENEKVDFGNVKQTRGLEKLMFTYHIANAFYEMFGIEQKAVAFATRVNPKRKTEEERKKTLYTGNFIHRDFAGVDPFKIGKFPTFATFSAPLDDEHALTDLFFLEDVLESLPKAVRERTLANVEFREIISLDEDQPANVWSLQKVLEYLQSPPSDGLTIAIVDPRNKDVPGIRIANNPADIKLVADAVEENSDRKFLGKGSMLILCEDKIFHQGNPGDPNAIDLISPEQYATRVFLHNSGILRDDVPNGNSLEKPAVVR